VPDILRSARSLELMCQLFAALAENRMVEVGGATIVSLYVSPAAARLGVGSSLLTHAERKIRDAGASIAYLDASPNAEAFYARRGYRRGGEVKSNNSIPMSKRLEPQSRLTSRLSGPT